jgi:3-methyladenine DNA glycosylase AlkD
MDARGVLRRIAGLPRRSTAAIRALRRKISKELAVADRQTVLKLALQLVSTGDPAGRWVAYELIQHHPVTPMTLSPAEVEQLGRGISSWSAVDCFACYISGPAWRERRIRDTLIHRWARSDDRWWRRAALVSTVPLNVRAQGGCGDTHRTLAVCELLLDDRDDMVVKALSWALRALSRHDPAAVADFVRQHEDRLAALVKREVRNKLATGLKNPRSKSRSAAQP